MARLIDRLARRLEIPRDADGDAQTLLDTEWIVTNGLGGYSSASVAGVITRRYHGMLVAALPNPLGRTVMLNHLGARLVCGDGRGTNYPSPERCAHVDGKRRRRAGGKAACRKS